MSQPYLGTITLFAGNYAPENWAICNGQLLSIGTYQALFSLIGTTYGGDGRSTFAVPDLRSRLPLHQGAGTNLTPRAVGQSFGTESVALLATQMPAHTHPVFASSLPPSQSSPAGGLLASPGTAYNNFAAIGGSQPVALSLATVVPAGSSLPHNNLMPYLALNFIIAVQGVYPTQN